MSVLFVGNDVVDLTNARTQGRASDERFMARVFGELEQAAIRGSGGSDVELWSRWAAKEAGFKAISKAMGTAPTFLHRTFEVEWTWAEDAGESSRGAAAEGALVREGRVTHADRIAAVRVWASSSTVHAVAMLAPGGPVEATKVHRRLARLEDPSSRWSGPLENLMRRFSEREADAVKTLESAAVRLGAREEVARLLRVAEERVEIVCPPGPSTRRPPQVLVDGCGARVDVSLSHDGGWIAWAIWVDG